MSTPVDEPASGRAAATRELLLRAASEQFERAGYQGASLSMILKATGVTKGALYFHFDSKMGLAEAIIEEATHRRRAAVVEAGQEHRDALNNFVTGVRASIAVSLDDPVVRGADRLLDDPLIDPDLAHDQYIAGESLVHGILASAQNQGLLRDGVDPHTTASDVVMTILESRLVCARTRRTEQLPPRIDKMLFSTLRAIASESWLRANPDFAEPS